MKRYSRDRNAVSPVIATILLVAITIILVGLLFAWIMPMIETPKESTPDINVALSVESDGEETYFKVLITEVDREPSLNHIKYKIYQESGDQIEEMRADSEVYGNLAHMQEHNGEPLGVGFSDSDSNGLLTVGDYFLVKQHFDKKYSDDIDISGGGMSIVYIPTGSLLEDIDFKL
ncbi:MAG: type IV pilin [Candidatus Thermoplasmatota archaeon]|nr:type IV pilin [Candidatus Thermoplasmatota archaeon]